MKRVLICALLLASLAACTGSSYFDRPNCSARGELCIEVRAAEPVEFGGQALITVTVTSDKNISDLGVSIYYEPDVVLEVPQEWEKESRDAIIWNMGSSWKTTTEADKPLVIKRTLLLPPRKGNFRIKAMASTDEFRAADVLYILMTPDGGKVYLSGTGIPRTPGPEMLGTIDPILLKTLWARLTVTATPIVSPSAMSTPVIYPTLPAKPTLTPAPKGTLPVTQTPTPTGTKGTEAPPPVIIGTPPYPYP